MKIYFYFNFSLFFGCGDDTEAIKLKGFDTEVNLAALLEENFHKVNPHVRSQLALHVKLS